jgi:hypothetical protein
MSAIEVIFIFILRTISNAASGVFFPNAMRCSVDLDRASKLMDILHAKVIANAPSRATSGQA